MLNKHEKEFKKDKPTKSSRKLLGAVAATTALALPSCAELPTFDDMSKLGRENPPPSVNINPTIIDMPEVGLGEATYLNEGDIQRYTPDHPNKLGEPVTEFPE